MTTQHQCMALNRDMTARCQRRATKMLATQLHPSYQRGSFGTRDLQPSSLPTVYLCGICNRSLHSGSRSLCLETDDGTRHTCWVGHGIGETYTKQDRGEA